MKLCLWTGLLLLGSVGVAQAVPVECVASAGTNCPARIPDAPQGGLVSTINVTATSCPAGSLPQLSVGLNVTHAAVGDLVVTLANPAGATATLLSNLPGSAGACRGSDIGAVFSDDGVAATCSMLIPTLTGVAAPVSPLSALTADPPTGTWTLTVTDTVNSGDGALNDWSVDAGCRQLVAPAPVSTPLSWQMFVVLAALLALIGFGALRRRGHAR
jgi:subtilisin-like proprotein convertase family protein